MGSGGHQDITLPQIPFLSLRFFPLVSSFLADPGKRLKLLPGGKQNEILHILSSDSDRAPIHVILALGTSTLLPSHCYVLQRRSKHLTSRKGVLASASSSCASWDEEDRVSTVIAFQLSINQFASNKDTRQE